MSKRGIVKAVISLIGGSCAGFTIEQVLKNYSTLLPTLTSKTKKIQFTIGSILLGAFVSDKISDYVDKTVDQVYDFMDDVRIARILNECEQEEEEEEE